MGESPAKDEQNPSCVVSSVASQENVAPLILEGKPGTIEPQNHCQQVLFKSTFPWFMLLKSIVNGFGCLNACNCYPTPALKEPTAFVDTASLTRGSPCKQPFFAKLVVTPNHGVLMEYLFMYAYSPIVNLRKSIYIYIYRYITKQFGHVLIILICSKTFEMPVSRDTTPNTAACINKVEPPKQGEI